MTRLSERERAEAYDALLAALRKADLYARHLADQADVSRDYEDKASGERMVLVLWEDVHLLNEVVRSALRGGARPFWSEEDCTCADRDTHWSDCPTVARRLNDAKAVRRGGRP